MMILFRLSLIVVVYLTVLFFYQRKMIFPRHVIEASDYSARAERVVHWIESDEGPVESWLLLSDQGEVKKKPVVIFAHGNAELIDHWPNLFQHYLKMGIHVYLPEYRGYGRSKGSPSREKINQDMLAFYDWLVQRDDVDPEKIILHGRSLGGGVMADLARARPFRGLILQSTFYDVGPLALRMLAPPILIRDRFETLSLVKNLQRPYLVVHGKRDGVIPFSHAEKLVAANPHLAQSYYYQGDHGFEGISLKQYWEIIRQYLISVEVIAKN